LEGHLVGHRIQNLLQLEIGRPRRRSLEPVSLNKVKFSALDAPVATKAENQRGPPRINGTRQKISAAQRLCAKTG
jgi:hypothetical protein